MIEFSNVTTTHLIVKDPQQVVELDRSINSTRHNNIDARLESKPLGEISLGQKERLIDEHKLVISELPKPRLVVVHVAKRIAR